MVKNTMVIWVSFTVYYISYIIQCYNLLPGIVMSEILQSRSVICFVSMDYLVKDCFFWKKSRFRCSSMHYPILPFIFYENYTCQKKKQSCVLYKLSRVVSSYIDIGGGCWRRFMLVTCLRGWWPFLYNGKVENIRKKVTNNLKLSAW